MSEVVGWLAGIGAVVGAGIGLVLAFRAAKDRGRHAALDEAQLAQADAIECRRLLYQARKLLADNGIPFP